MSLETRKPEYPYVVKIETATGESKIPVAFLTADQLEDFLQSDFKRLVEEAGLRGVRIHVERAPTADYQRVLNDVAAYLQKKPVNAA